MTVGGVPPLAGAEGTTFVFATASVPCPACGVPDLSRVGTGRIGFAELDC